MNYPNADYQHGELRCHDVGTLESIGRAVRALRQEILGFRVDYPIEIVPEAMEGDALRYYLFSNRLFLENLEFDSEGVPLKRYRLLGAHYNPLFIAWWGLHHLELAAREHDDRHLDVFESQIDWLCRNAVSRDDGAIVWSCNFNWQEGRARLCAPWISAMYQGVVISTLVRGYRLTGNETLINLALSASRVFSADVKGGGVRSYESGIVLYEEYPAYPLPRILDGFLFSLLGLYDLYVQSQNEEVYDLFADGVNGLVHHLDWWNYRGKWSWYGSHNYLCPPHYHQLNRSLLLVLSRLTGETALAKQAEQWSPETLSWADKLEIYSCFLVTKNWARLRLPNEKGD